MTSTVAGILIALVAAANAVWLAAVAARNSRRWRAEDHRSLLDQHGPPAA